MKRLAAALVLLVLAVPAIAATRYVSPSGNGGVYTLATPGGLDSANVVADSGDVVVLLPGTYTYPIEPVKNGGYLAGNRITYVGDISNPDTTIVQESEITRRNISVKGVRFLGSLTFGWDSGAQFARYDSLLYCEVQHTLGLNRCKDVKVYSTTITGGVGRFTMNSEMSSAENGFYSVPIPEGNRVSYCTLNIGSNVTSGGAIMIFRQAQRDTLDHCQINISTTTAATNEIDPMIMYFSAWNRFYDNKWTITNNSPQTRLWRLRDSTHHVTVTRDTFTFTGNQSRFCPHVSGTAATSSASYGAYSNKFEYLLIKNTCDPQDNAIEFQDGMRADTLVNCAVFCENGRALHSTGGADTVSGLTASVVDHCTLVGAGPATSSGNLGGAVFVESNDDAWTYPASIQFTNNIVYHTGEGLNRHTMGWGFLTPFDIISTSNNLYYRVDGLESNAISFQTGIGNNATIYSSPPGAGSSFNTYKPGQELNSLWGDPLLGNVTAEGFDYTLGALSPARSRGTNGTDIGVNAPATTGGDVIRPAPLAPYVGDVKNNEITLSWTAVGDDSLSGTCASYDARYSTSPITNESEWSAATQLTGELTPRPAGSEGEFLRVTGLTNRTYYYFVVRAVDEAGNKSALHTSVCAYTPYFCAD